MNFTSLPITTTHSKTLLRLLPPHSNMLATDTQIIIPNADLNNLPHSLIKLTQRKLPALYLRIPRHSEQNSEDFRRRHTAVADFRGPGFAAGFPLIYCQHEFHLRHCTETGGTKVGMLPSSDS